MKRLRDSTELLHKKNDLLKLLKVIEETVDINEFAELFKRDKDGRIPIPINNLILWQAKYPKEIFVVRDLTTLRLELCINRIALMKEHKVPLKVLQCFERCLMSVKPKLEVTQTTHGHEIKKFSLVDVENIATESE